MILQVNSNSSVTAITSAYLSHHTITVKCDMLRLLSIKENIKV